MWVHIYDYILIYVVMLLPHSVSLISMEFQLKQLYLIEGYKPICINIDASYSVENGDQEYLWPVRIFIKGRLTTCDETLGKINYLPIRNLHKLVIIGALNGVTCVFGFILHCFKLLTFISIGKVHKMCYNTLAILYLLLISIEGTRLCYKETP